jgi:hypothetical protein
VLSRRVQVARTFRLCLRTSLSVDFAIPPMYPTISARLEWNGLGLMGGFDLSHNFHSWTTRSHLSFLSYLLGIFAGLRRYRGRARATFWSSTSKVKQLAFLGTYWLTSYGLFLYVYALGLLTYSGHSNPLGQPRPSLLTLSYHRANGSMGGRISSIS